MPKEISCSWFNLGKKKQFGTEFYWDNNYNLITYSVHGDYTGWVKISIMSSTNAHHTNHPEWRKEGCGILTVIHSLLLLHRSLSHSVLLFSSLQVIQCVFISFISISVGFLLLTHILHIHSKERWFIISLGCSYSISHTHLRSFRCHLSLSSDYDFRWCAWFIKHHSSMLSFMSARDNNCTSSLSVSSVQCLWTLPFFFVFPASLLCTSYVCWSTIGMRETVNPGEILTTKVGMDGIVGRYKNDFTGCSESRLSCIMCSICCADSRSDAISLFELCCRSGTSRWKCGILRSRVNKSAMTYNEMDYSRDEDAEWIKSKSLDNLIDAIIHQQPYGTSVCGLHIKKQREMKVGMQEVDRALCHVLWNP